MLSLQVIQYIAKEDADTFLTALRPCWERVVAEPKCVFFDVFRTTDPTDANIEMFNFIEIWDATEDWLINVQVKKAYYEPYLKIATALWKKDREFKLIPQSEGWLSVREQYLAKARRG